MCAILIFMKKEPQISKVIAHRGVPVAVPENTIAGLHKAKELRAEWIEFDLRLSRDGEIVVMHDTTVDRTTNGVGEISDMLFEEIAQLDAGDGQHVPLFERWVKVALSLGINIIPEIKTTGREAPLFAEKVHAVLRKLWPDHLPPPLVSSSEQRFIETYRDIDPDAYLAFGSCRMPFRWRARLKKMGVSALVVARQAVTEARIQALHDEGYQVLVFTVNELAEAERIFKMGADSIFTDNIAVMSSFL